MDGKGRRQVINRLKRIEGQIRGLEKMIENETSCLDILTQVSAVNAAVKKAGSEVVRIYMDQCFADTANQAGADKEKRKTEFQKVLARYIDMA